MKVILFVASCIILEEVLGALENWVLIEDASIEFVNSSYADIDTLDVSVNYKEDEPNSLRFYADVKMDLPEETYMKLSATARAFGVYRVPTGLSIDANICDENKKNFMGIILDFIGIRECPPKKGVYSNEDFMPEVPSFAVYALHNVHLCVDAVLYGKPDIMLMKLKIFLKIN